MIEGEPIRAGFAQRTTDVLDRVEGAYLRILRVAILVAATVILIYAAWLGFNSLYKISRSTDSVVEQVAKVSADEITSAQAVAPADRQAAAEPKTNPALQAYYADFLTKYYQLYRTKFEPYRQPDDKALTKDAFDDAYLNTEARLESILDGTMDLETEMEDLDGLLAVMTTAAGKPMAIDRLKKYKQAKKVEVTRQVQRTRTTYREGWDRYSTNCDEWYYEPIGCPVRRAVETPYTETVKTMEYPKGTQSHAQIFGAFQDKYFALLLQRRDANAAKASNERDAILEGNEQGKVQLVTMVQVFGGFIALMFFFLLIAIERHQRRLSAVASDALSVGGEPSVQGTNA